MTVDATGNWSPNPLIYEIYTALWLNDLSARHGREVTLANVPDAEWEAIAALGVDAVWLMGVWERSPAGVAVALANERLLADFRQALPDFTPADVIGSAYCIRRYVVDARFGGPDGLAVARTQMRRHGLRLILDYVPNHVAHDHPLASEQPELFVRGDDDDLAAHPEAFVRIGEQVLACGRDPFFPAWPDVVQLNAFNTAMRATTVATLSRIAEQADGVRCDMAMLLINRIFGQTWGQRAGVAPEEEFWPEVIQAVRSAHLDFLFIAEAYWDLEWELQQQGFDYCYDKRLYDRLLYEDATSVRDHLAGDAGYQRHLVRFIENHDEPRSNAAFAPERLHAAALTALTASGARLLYEGQLEGRRNQPPVFLNRRVPEEPDPPLLAGIHRSRLGNGAWRMLPTSGWPDNQRHEQLLAWSWQGAPGSPHVLVIINFAGQAAQGVVQVPWDDLSGRTWQLHDQLTGIEYVRDGTTMTDDGLYVELDAWNSHLFTVQ